MRESAEREKVRFAGGFAVTKEPVPRGSEGDVL